MAEVSRKVLGWRLRLAPYLYSAFYDSHAHGCPVARPLFFVFPADATTLLLREQWMMGARWWCGAEQHDCLRTMFEMVRRVYSSTSPAPHASDMHLGTLSLVHGLPDHS